MKFKKHLAVLLSAGILISYAGISMRTPATETIVANAAYETEAERIISLINTLRSQNGLNAFDTTPAMQQAAEARAAESLQKFSNKRPNGQAGATIMKEYGINYGAGACCIAGDCSSADEVFSYLSGVSGERSKMLSTSYKYIGVGVTKDSSGYYYAALLFSDRAEQQPVETEPIPEETTTTTEETTTTTTTTTTEETTTTTTTTTTEETTTTTTTTTPEETTTTTTTTTTETSTTTTTTTTTPETTTTATEETKPAKAWGDIEQDGSVNAKDAAKVLVYAAHAGSGMLHEISWDEQERVRNFADLNNDGQTNAKDAAVILEYSADFGTHKTEKSIAEYVKEKFYIWLPE